MEPATPLVLVLRGQHAATPDLWAAALKALFEPEKKTLLKIAEPSREPGTIYDGIRDMIKTLKAKSNSAMSAWEIKIGNCTFDVRNILKGLHAFLAVGDSLMQYDPTHLALPWAGIRFLVMVCVNSEEQSLALLQVVERFVLILHRCRIIEELYTNTTCRPDKSCIESLRRALVSLYTTVLTILTQCLLHQSRNKAARRIVDLLTPNRVTVLLDELGHAEADMDKETAVCRWQLRADLDDATRLRLVKLEDCLNEFRIPLQRIDETTTKVLHNVEDTHWKEVLDWISDVKFGNLHDSICHSRTEGTCEWLLHHPQFKQWVVSNPSAILWIKGAGGTGKTVLMSKVVDYMVSRHSSHGTDEVFAYFYCSYRDSAQSSAISIIRSILRQLSSASKATRPRVHEELNTLYEECQLCGRSPTFAMCKARILEISGTYNVTRIVIDGLNECDQTTRNAISTFLVDLACEAPKTVKILLASRYTLDISESLGDYQGIEIDMDISHEDIVKFQWVALHLRQIRTLVLPSAVLRQLSQLNMLPAGLGEVYDRLYKQITQRNESEAWVAIRILQWVQCSAVPPTTSELRFAVQTDITKYSADFDEDLTNELILTLTSYLIVLDGAEGTWRFTHSSVLEYLEARHGETYNRQRIHEEAAYNCLFVLIQGLPDELSTEADDQGTSYSAFASYAKWCWPFHLRALAGNNLSNPKLRELLPIFFGVPKVSGSDYQVWAEAMLDERPPQRFCSIALSQPSTHHLRPTNNAMFGLCIMGITAPLYRWIKPPIIEPDECNAESWCLLSLAVFHGQSHIWKFLLFHRADCNRYDGSYYGGPLATAAATSALATQDMLNYGGNSNLSLFTGFGTPLASASMEGEVEAMEILVKGGADPDMGVGIPSIPSTALGIAAWRGNIKAAQKLIDLGATVDLDLPGLELVRPGTDLEPPLPYYMLPRYGSALAAAAGMGKLSMVKLLIDSGAKINKPLESSFGSALAAAVGALRSNPEVVHYLLEHGNEHTINQPLGGLYGTALVAAVWARKGGAEDFQEELEEVHDMPGHDPTRFGEFAAALHARIESKGLEHLQRGDSQIVKILLDSRARVVNTAAEEGDRMGACEAALDAGNPDVIEMIFLRLEMEWAESEMEVDSSGT